MDSTNIYAYIPFICLLVSVILTTNIEAKTRAGRLKRAYIYFSLALIFWIFGDLLLWLRLEEAWYVPILKMQSIFWLPVGALFLNFISAYLDLKNNTIVRLTLWIALAAIVITVSTDYVISGYRDVYWGILHKPGPLHAIFTNLVVTLPMAYGLFLLLLSIKGKSRTQDNTASLILLIGTTSASAISYVTTVYFPDVLGRTDILPLHDVGIAIHSIFVSIAVTRYRLLNINLADVADDMFARMHDGVLILDGMGIIKHANFSAREMLGLGFAEIPERKISQYFSDYPASMAFSNYEMTLLKEKDASVYSVTQAPTEYGKRESGKLVILRNISEEKKTEKEIRKMNLDLARARDEALESSKLKSQFLANMSHELRTPLNAVIGYSEIIQEEATDLAQEQIADDADKINRAGKHLLSLINDILDLSKIEAGKMDVYIETINLNELLQDVVITAQPLMKKNNNTFEANTSNVSGLIESDHIKVRQILFNLVSNASKFTKNGTVSLDVSILESATTSNLQLKVSDTGIGMTAAQLEKLYSAFSQADPSTTRQYGGTGLGMAITRHFVELLNGHIDVTSEPEIGTEFIVTLPITYTRATLEQNADNAITHRADNDTTVKVLVVDDDEPTRELIARYLSGEGFTVLMAENGTQAIEQTLNNRPDLITLDVMMPGKDGWTVLNQLKSDPRITDIPVIMMSMVDNQTLGYALGASEYLVKPVNRQKLVNIVRRTLSKEHGKQVLIIEDDDDMANLMVALLEEARYEVKHANNGQQALAFLEHTKPSMIVLDLVMPVMNGFEFMKILRGKSEYSDIPVVVLSAEELSDSMKAELDAVAAELISKNLISPMRLVEDIKAKLNIK